MHYFNCFHVDCTREHNVRVWRRAQIGGTRGVSLLVAGRQGFERPQPVAIRLFVSHVYEPIGCETIRTGILVRVLVVTQYFHSDR